MARRTGKVCRFLEEFALIRVTCRWLKISQAMHGRRTARQVASRVQKFNEKLKKFGESEAQPNHSVVRRLMVSVRSVMMRPSFLIQPAAR